MCHLCINKDWIWGFLSLTPNKRGVCVICVSTKTGFGSCWIEGKNWGSTNSCKDDVKEFRQEAFIWRHHTTEITNNDIISETKGRNHETNRNRFHSRHISNPQHTSYCNDYKNRCF